MWKWICASGLYLKGVVRNAISTTNCPLATHLNVNTMSLGDNLYRSLKDLQILLYLTRTRIPSLLSGNRPLHQKSIYIFFSSFYFLPLSLPDSLHFSGCTFKQGASPAEATPWKFKLKCNYRGICGKFPPHGQVPAQHSVIGCEGLTLSFIVWLSRSVFLK